MREIELGKLLGEKPQPNIVTFIGCVTTQGKHLKDPGQLCLCFCLHARVSVAHFTWSVIKQTFSNTTIQANKIFLHYAIFIISMASKIAKAE